MPKEDRIIIGVVSDTHSFNLPDQMLKDFKKVDFIIHAGDFCDRSVFETLARVKDVKGVYGNMDDSAIRDQFPRRQILECDGWKIGIVHGAGPRNTVLDKVKAEFISENVHAVVFGHTHHALNEMFNGVLYFNPGSPNDQIFAPFCSYGKMTLGKSGIHAEIIHIKDKK